MNKVLYEALLKYFNSLFSLGYISYSSVNKLLFLIAIQELIYKDFNALITEEDYRNIDRALYCIFGTSCLVPFPEFCNNSDMNKLHLGDLIELAYRIKRNEEITKNNYTEIASHIANIEKTKVVKVDNNSEQVENITNK